MIQIAIDGHSGSGKGELSKGLAQKFNLKHLDTGAILRAIGLYFYDRGITSPSQEDILAHLENLNVKVQFEENTQKTYLNGTDVSKTIRTEQIGQMASRVAVFKETMKKLIDISQEFANHYDCVLDGRNITSEVLPDADVKIFLDAKPEIRARRRFVEMQKKNPNITFDEVGNASFDFIRYGKYVGRIQLAVAGNHNVSNALSAIAAAETLEISLETIQNGLLSFTGTDRRFQYKGVRNGVTIIDDYAHHPTEIRATLTSAKNYPHREIWCIFQPHTYTRTKAFFHEFADALSLADHIVLADIYAARETDTLGMSSEALATELKNLGADAYYFSTFDAIENFVLKKCIHGDVLITMGAGDVVNIGNSLLK